jgi:hypothetical protein
VRRIVICGLGSIPRRVGTDVYRYGDRVLILNGGRGSRWLRPTGIVRRVSVRTVVVDVDGAWSRVYLKADLMRYDGGWSGI